MSRIGFTPISLPDGVQLQVDKTNVRITGPKGELSLRLHNLVDIAQADAMVRVTRKNNSKQARSLHGTYQSLIHNMVVGVTDGYQKDLELVGTGYRVTKQGKQISMTLGLSHPVTYTPPEGVELTVEGNNKITVSGIDKHLVGQVAANIRGFRPPEPYKGKGIRYQGERIRRKAGKAAKAA